MALHLHTGGMPLAPELIPVLIGLIPAGNEGTLVTTGGTFVGKLTYNPRPVFPFAASMTVKRRRGKPITLGLDTILALG